MGIQKNVGVLTSSQMKEKASFAGFDFKNVWEFDTSTGYNYPVLKNVPYTAENKEASADIDHSKYLVVKAVEAPTYDGTAKEPKVIVSYKNELLKENTDYTISYANNVNAGKTAEFTVVGIGKYEDVKVTDNFQILKADISSAEIVIDDSDSIFSGTPVSAQVTVSSNGVVLEEGVDYNVQFYNNTAAGNGAVARIIGIGNYIGSVDKEFTVGDVEVDTLESPIVMDEIKTVDATIAKDTRLTFEFGEEFNSFHIYYEGQLVNSYYSDIGNLSMTFAFPGKWEVRYSFVYYETDVSINNGRPSYSTTSYYGTCLYNITVVGDGSTDLLGLEAAFPYGTEMRHSYLNFDTEFLVEDLSSAEWKSSDDSIVSVDETGMLTYHKYGDAEVTATIGDKVAKYDVSTVGLDLEKSGTLVSFDPATKKAVVVFAGELLEEGTDYTLTVKDKKAYYAVYADGKGIYTGQVKGSFSKTDGTPFKRIPLSSGDVKLSYTSTTYTGSAKKPSVTIKGLEKGVDYTVEYKNNTKAGTAKVVVTGTGEYSGTVTKTFKIKAKSAASFSAKLSGTKYTHNGKTKTPSVTVKDANGNKLKKGTDYTVSYSSDSRKNVGKYTVTIKYKGNYTGSKKLTFYILPSKTSKITPTCSTTSIKATWKSVTGATGYKVELLSAKGKVLKTKSTEKLTYTFKDLSKVTTYKIRVTAYKKISDKKHYSLSSTTLITSTSPAKTTLKVSTGKSQATLSWKKITCTGYEIVYSTSSSFSSATKVDVAKNTTLKKTIKKLKKGKTYYFKVRTYKTVDGKKVYGAYSSVVKAKIK